MPQLKPFRPSGCYDTAFLAAILEHPKYDSSHATPGNQPRSHCHFNVADIPTPPPAGLAPAGGCVVIALFDAEHSEYQVYVFSSQPGNIVTVAAGARKIRRLPDCWW